MDDLHFSHINNFFLKEKKNPVNNNQGWEPIQQKYKANEDTTQRKNKSKQ
jgi:hypothetical protein